MPSKETKKILSDYANDDKRRKAMSSPEVKQKTPLAPSLKPKRKGDKSVGSYMGDLFSAPQGKMKKDYGKPKGKR